MRVGIFGGSFDPVHYGHLWMAELSREELGLDEVIFIPTATSPLKPQGPVASNDQRVAMLRLALSGHPQMRVDTREIDRGGKSFTVDTVAEITQERSSDELFLLLGTDAFNSLPLWKQPERLLQFITPIVLRRGGEPEADWAILGPLAAESQIQRIKSSALIIPTIEVSSGELRQRVSKGKSIRYRLPHAVEAFITAEKLYR